MVSMLNAPRIELEPFTGDPLKYKAFLSMFNELVDKTEMSFDSKLARLIQCTEGEARGSIDNCAISGGESGYNKALTILAERFVNSHLFTRSVIRNITEGKTILLKELIIFLIKLLRHLLHPKSLQCYQKSIHKDVYFQL